MGRAFEYRKAAKMKRWGHMARTFTKIGKQIAIAVKAGGPEPENNPTLRAIIANAKRENMPKDNIERAIKNAMGKDQSEYKVVTYEGYVLMVLPFLLILSPITPRVLLAMFVRCSTSLMATWAPLVHFHSFLIISLCSLSRKKMDLRWMN